MKFPLNSERSLEDGVDAAICRVAVFQPRSRVRGALLRSIGDIDRAPSFCRQHVRGIRDIWGNSWFFADLVKAVGVRVSQDFGRPLRIFYG